MMMSDIMFELADRSWSLAGALTLLTGATAVLYDKSPQFRYYFKFVMLVVMVSMCTLLVIPLCIWRPKDVRNVRWGMPYAVRVSAFLGITWHVEGAEHLEKDASCIIVCNHQSMLDFSGMAALWPYMKKCTAVAKRAIMYIPPFGIMAYLCGTVFIDRSKTAESRATMSASAASLKESKTKLWIFPEGTRTRGNSLLPFKKGAFYIAVEHKLPIVPVVISPYTFIDDEKKTFNTGHMIVRVLPPIETDGYDVKDVGKLAETTRSLMTEEFQKLTVEAHGLNDLVYPREKNETIFNLDLTRMKAD